MHTLASVEEISSLTVDPTRNKQDETQEFSHNKDLPHKKCVEQCNKMSTENRIPDKQQLLLTLRI